ncbi:Hypothetical predicted protein [Octopus vulgaris]|uniref:Uncharacterized protein n=1 Tax=Octopus vulgaris TaxID=6645 RepID=A0AA36BG35_OCTVU|nr:Hypothetical predicted protein [Octopus vulgaris]
MLSFCIAVNVVRSKNIIVNQDYFGKEPEEPAAVCEMKKPESYGAHKGLIVFSDNSLTEMTGTSQSKTVAQCNQDNGNRREIEV